MKKSSASISTSTTSSRLREDVAAVYAVRKGLQSVFACSEFGRVDLSQVDMQFAAQLAQYGYLKKLDQTDPS